MFYFSLIHMFIYNLWFRYLINIFKSKHLRRFKVKSVFGGTADIKRSKTCDPLPWKLRLYVCMLLNNVAVTTSA